MMAWESIEKQLIDVRDQSWASVLQTYGAARSLRYLLELLPLALLRNVRGRKVPKLQGEDLQHFRQIVQEVWLLIKQDSERMAAGIYPASVLRPDLSLTYGAQFLQLWLRGTNKNSRHLDAEALEALRDVPGYYRQHFKYAGNLFLDPHSAPLHEHQMELFFFGAMDAMRRLILAPMKKAFRFSEGEGLRFLEIGCGAGRMTQFVKMAFPKAKIVALDASPVYLKEAQKNLIEFNRVDFIQGDALDLPFKDKRFDVVYMSFLLHEVPLELRRQILAEAHRVLGDKGWMGVVDLLQHDDCRDLNWTLDQAWFGRQQPHFKEYVKNSVSGSLQHLGLEGIAQERGFLGKAVFGVKV